MLGASLHSALFPQYQRRRTDTPDATLQPIGDERTYFVDALASVFGHDLAYAAGAAGARTSITLLTTPPGKGVASVRVLHQSQAYWRQRRPLQGPSARVYYRLIDNRDAARYRSDGRGYLLLPRWASLDP